MSPIRSSFSFPTLLAVSTLAISCSKSADAPGAQAHASGPPVVQAVNYPLTYFAERIAGDLIDLRFLPGESDGDPAFWTPSDDEVIALQSADLLLLNGATYAKWRDKASLPESILVDTSAAFQDKFLISEHAVTHSHGKDGMHSHAGTAFTTWIDFQQARQQAEAIRDAFIALLPDHKTEIETNFEALAEDLGTLHAEFSALGKAIGDQPLVASHPIYQYFARRYGLNLKTVLWEPEIVPDDEAIAGLKKILQDHPAKWMIWEGKPAAESVEKLKALGLGSVVVDPCGNRPDSGDWLSVMKANAENLRQIATP